MRVRVYQLFAAGLFIAGVAGFCGPASAQAAQGIAPETAAPNPQARDKAMPAPGGPERPKPEGDAEAQPGESDMQQGCPDQRRPLQLIV